MIRTEKPPPETTSTLAVAGMPTAWRAVARTLAVCALTGSRIACGNPCRQAKRIRLINANRMGNDVGIAFTPTP
jgi:hypothetical protein